jgi:hypothetical protein
MNSCSLCVCLCIPPSVILEYNGTYREHVVVESLSVYNVCRTFDIHLSKGLSAQWVCLVKLPENTEFPFTGKGLNAEVTGSVLVKGGVYAVRTNPVDVNADTRVVPEPLIITVRHMQQTATFDLSGKTGLVKFRYESDLGVDRDIFESLGLRDANGVEWPFVKSETALLDEIRTNVLVHGATYTTWVHDRREEMLQVPLWMTIFR